MVAHVRHCHVERPRGSSCGSSVSRSRVPAGDVVKVLGVRGTVIALQLRTICADLEGECGRSELWWLSRRPR